MGDPQGYLDAGRRRRGRDDHGRHQRGALLGRMGRDLQNDGKNEGRRQQSAQILFLGIQRSGHHRRSRSLRTHLRKEPVPRPMVLLGRQTVAAL